jgi:hypothetical protein
MENLKGVELIVSIASQLTLEAVMSKDEHFKKVRCLQASHLIKACSDLSGKSVIDLLVLSKAMTLSMNDGYRQFEREMEGEEILKNIFKDEENKKGD